MEVEVTRRTCKQYLVMMPVLKGLFVFRGAV